MLGIMMIFVMGAILSPLIIVPKWFSKLGKDSKKKRYLFGSLGFLIVFSIYFGDHIVRRIYLDKMCNIYAKNDIFNPELYKKYKKSNSYLKFLKLSDLENEKDKLGYIYNEILDNKGEWIRYHKDYEIISYELSPKSPCDFFDCYASEKRIYDVSNKKIIFDSIGLSMSEGWFFNINIFGLTHRYLIRCGK